MRVSMADAQAWYEGRAWPIGPIVDEILEVYGAITFYLGHRSEVDQDLASREGDEDAFSESHPAPANLKGKLDHARDHLHSR